MRALERIVDLTSIEQADLVIYDATQAAQRGRAAARVARRVGAAVREDRNAAWDVGSTAWEAVRAAAWDAATWNAVWTVARAARSAVWAARVAVGNVPDSTIEQVQHSAIDLLARMINPNAAPAPEPNHR